MNQMTQEELDRQRMLANAAALGVGTTGTLAGWDAYKGIMQERAEAKKPRTRDWQKFLATMQPGDIIFHRRPSKYSSQAELRGFKMPYKESDLLTAAKGDPYYHTSVYRGKGISTEAANADDGVKNTRLHPDDPDELMVYRPKQGQRRAARFLDAAKGVPYKSDMETFKHGIAHLAGMQQPTGNSVCKLTKQGSVCTELTAEAYPKIFKDKLMSPKDMRRSDQLNFVGKYGSIPKMAMREKILSNAVYPVLKNAKWGALAGALGLGALALTGDEPAIPQISALDKWKKQNER
jgi:hypothetical protein